MSEKLWRRDGVSFCGAVIVGQHHNGEAYKFETSQTLGFKIIHIVSCDTQRRGLESCLRNVLVSHACVYSCRVALPVYPKIARKLFELDVKHQALDKRKPRNLWEMTWVRISKVVN
ncbi:uncharacterized protein [Physcomitrium patens]|uniref:uncharacterized protein n=1 Tax=Physcomitrium patens TaxID=3218 RepID=UPI003CCDE4EB